MSTGLRGRCPNCGEGTLFDGFLKFARACEGCGESFDLEDAGDGPAVFVIFITGFIIVPLAIAFQFITDAPYWLTLVIWIPILVIASLALLRPLRGIMFNLQWDNEALEIRSDEFED